jgi:hypothetical protein
MIKEYFRHCRTEEELRREHRKLVVQMHPDRNPEDPDATAKFQEMQAQYEEKLAELHGDYRAGDKGRARRAQAQREEEARREREKREREKHRVEEIINQARRNKNVGFDTLKTGDYIYARRIVNDMKSGFVSGELNGNQIANIAFRNTPLGETIVKIEKIYELDDCTIMGSNLSSLIDDVYGGYEVLQDVGSCCKGKRVARVIMFRSRHYVFFGNSKGDFVVSVYYVSLNYEDMFADQHFQYLAELKRQEEERRQRMAQLEAEQKPLIEEWKGKLTSISAALTAHEKETVAVSNLLTMLKAKYPGAKFRKVTVCNYALRLDWEDGPTVSEVVAFSDLFNHQENETETPWERRFGHVVLPEGSCLRKMSTLAKAAILEQLGVISDVFAKSDYTDEVEVDDADWLLMHLLVGVNVANGDSDVCPSRINNDGKRKVYVDDAVMYVFHHSSYTCKRKTAKRKKTGKAVQ